MNTHDLARRISDAIPPRGVHLSNFMTVIPAGAERADALHRIGKTKEFIASHPECFTLDAETSIVRGVAATYMRTTHSPAPDRRAVMMDDTKDTEPGIVKTVIIVGMGATNKLHTLGQREPATAVLYVSDEDAGMFWRAAWRLWQQPVFKKATKMVLVTTTVYEALDTESPADFVAVLCNAD